jgi:hypothetical protein
MQDSTEPERVKRPGEDHDPTFRPDYDLGPLPAPKTENERVQLAAFKGPWLRIEAMARLANEDRFRLLDPVVNHFHSRELDTVLGLLRDVGDFLCSRDAASRAAWHDLYVAIHARHPEYTHQGVYQVDDEYRFVFGPGWRDWLRNRERGAAEPITAEKGTV